MSKVKPISINVEIDPERVANMLISAFEGGSNYWYTDMAKGDEPPMKVCPLDTPGEDSNSDLTPHWYSWWPLFGGTITLMEYDEDGGDETKHTLDGKKIVRGLQIMAEKHGQHFGEFMRENDDAETADVFLQCCLFGDIVYG